MSADHRLEPPTGLIVVVNVFQVFDGADARPKIVTVHEPALPLNFAADLNVAVRPVDKLVT